MKPINILIVDDCPIMRFVIRKTVNLCQIETATIFEARNGDEGLKSIKNSDFDLVIADLNMPVMSGSEMIAKMRVDPAFDDVSILTISAESNDSRVGVLSGLTEGYVHKPFTTEDLRDKILKVFEKRAITNKDLS